MRIPHPPRPRQDLEAYRPRPHREYLAALRSFFWGNGVGVGGAVAEADDRDDKHALRRFIVVHKCVPAP